MFNITFSGNAGFNATFADTVEKQIGDYYTGPLEVTPSAETQSLATNGKIVPGDIVINPIPSNYGLIAWNGAILTVS